MLIAPLMFSCESLVQDVDLSGLEILEPKLVISGMISPEDSVLAVTISLSKPVFGPQTQDLEPVVYEGDTLYYQPKPLREAVVKLSNGSTEVPMIFNEQSRKYEYAQNTENPFVRAGNKYTINVSYQNYQASAFTIVPLEHAPDFEMTDFRVQKEKSQFGNVFIIPKLTFKWTDASAQMKYFVPQASLRYETVQRYQTGANTFREDTILNQNNFYFPGAGFGLIDNEEGYKREFLLTGNSFINTHSSIVIVNGVPQQPEDSAYYKIIDLKLRLNVVDENFAKFESSRAKSYDTDGNPFAEPTQLFTNVSNGLGYFGSVRKKTKSFVIAE